MKKLLFLFVLMIFFVCNRGYAQNANKLDTVGGIEGTYQFQLIGTRGYPLIPSDLKEIILKNRDQKAVIYKKLGTHLVLKILPTEEINKPGFKPIDSIVYREIEEN